MDPVTITAIAALIASLGGLIYNATIGQKNLAEAKKIRQDTSATAYQLHPNGGGSVSDSVKRTEGRVMELGKSVGGMRDDVRQLRDEKTNDHVDIRRRLDHIEQRVFPSAQTPSTVIQPPPPRRTQ